MGIFLTFWNIFFVISSLSLFSSTLFLLHQKRNQPCKARTPFITTAVNLILLLTFSALTFSYTTKLEIPCRLQQTTDGILLNLLLTLYALKAFVFWIRTGLLKERVALIALHRERMKNKRADSAMQLAEKAYSTWFERHKHFISDKNTQLISSIAVLTAAILLGLSMSFVTKDCARTTHTIVIIAVSSILLGIMYRFSHVNDRFVDSYGIYYEFRATSLLWVVVVLIWGILQIRDYHWVQNMAFLLTGVVLNSLSAWHPIYVSYRQNIVYGRRSNSDIMDDNDIFSQILENLETKVIFSEYLSRTFCVENLMFYEDVFEYRELAIDLYLKSTTSVRATGDILVEAEAIVAMYIVTNAEAQINLSDQIVNNIVETLAVVKKKQSEELERIENLKMQSFSVTKSKRISTAKNWIRRHSRGASGNIDPESYDLLKDQSDEEKTHHIRKKSGDYTKRRKSAGRRKSLKLRAKSVAKKSEWEEFLEEAKETRARRKSSGAVEARRKSAHNGSSRRKSKGAKTELLRGRAMSRGSILERFPLTTLFDEALKDTFYLMRSDSFGNFKRTLEYERCVRLLEEVRDAKKVMTEIV